MDFRSEIIEVVEVSGGDLDTPVDIHVHGAIADDHTFEVESSSFDDTVFIFDELFGEGGQVHACVGLATDPEAMFLEFWELFEPHFEGVEVVLCRLGVVVVHVVGIIVDGKSNSRGTLDE